MIRKLMSDAQWARIEFLLPGKPTDPGRTAADNRLFVEAVLWVTRTGIPWRDLPSEFGRWDRTYMRFSRWRKNGVWQRLTHALAGEADLQKLFIDSTIVRAHQHSSGAQKKQDRRPLAAHAAD